MNVYYRGTFEIKCMDSCGKCDDYRFVLDALKDEKNYIAYVTGNQAAAVALTAFLLLENNIKTVLLPWMIAEKNDFNCYKRLSYKGLEILIVRDVNPSSDWVLGMFTSGSTGAPQLFGFSTSQINKTLDWYHSIYKVDENSLIITAMPVTYNFSFIAGVCNMASVGGTFISANPSLVPRIIEKEGAKYDRIVILANPVLLDNFSDKIFEFKNLNLLVDSGGSPLSKNAIKIYRECGIDLREGYGLTETCSLTHFDTEAIADSIGTVGKGLADCRVEFVRINNRDYARIFTQNLGCKLKYDGSFAEENTEGGYLTTDIVRYDKDGRLELLGRKDDACINGYWPKDTLDLVGEIIGVKCSLVQHIEEDIVITFLKDDISIDIVAIKELIVEKIKCSEDNIKLFINDQEMLHSMKIKRK